MGSIYSQKMDFSPSTRRLPDGSRNLMASGELRDLVGRGSSRPPLAALIGYYQYAIATFRPPSRIRHIAPRIGPPEYASGCLRNRGFGNSALLGRCNCRRLQSERKWGGPHELGGRRTSYRYIIWYFLLLRQSRGRAQCELGKQLATRCIRYDDR